ncbi:MAG: DUF6505 family protein [Neomegalonema sp.]|nr:DUF6505 family protein [Neomegalonema sp.]
MLLARTIRFDESDLNIFDRPAAPDEWAVAGAFEFSNWSEADLTGKARQAFANGWLGLESFGRSTFVAIARAEPAERDAAIEALAQHFVEHYGAPDLDAARPVATEELSFIAELCADQTPNTLLIVERTLTETGVKESFRAIKPKDAELEAFAVHGDID